MSNNRARKRASNKPVAPKASTVPIGRVSISAKEPANKINYEELKRIILQNVRKTTNQTYVYYTKEKIQQYLQSPLANIDNIREVSRFLWRMSMPYRKIIEYYSSMMLFNYNVIYMSDLSKGMDAFQSDKFMKQYQTVLKRLENMKYHDEFPSIVATAMRDGAYFGFSYDDEETFFMSALDPKYCKINSIRDGVYDFSFDATFFDQGNNKYYIDAETNPDGLWDQIFIDGYNQYKDQGRDFRWFDIPPEKGLCVIAGDDPICPLPYFVSCFVDLLDLLDYQELIRNKTELENYVLLVSKIPLIPSSKDVNDFAVDLDLVQATQSLIDDVVPSLVGTAYTPCDLDVVRFNNRNQVEDTNIYGQALSNFMSNIGLSEMIGNSNKGGSVGLAASIKTDELVAFKFLNRLERWVQRYIALNISPDFIFKFHAMTYFSRDAYMDQMKDMATLGVPGKTMYATAMGLSPLELMNLGYFEKALKLDEIWTPLQSSYTQSAKEAGSPGVDDSELTDEGTDSREANKNEGTKAKKQIAG